MISTSALLGQLLVGLINGSFYAMLSLGLAIIFGLLNLVNFAHGAQYMLGALVAWMLLTYLGVGYWYALLIVPVVLALFGLVLERLFLRRVHNLDHQYGLLLTFGLAMFLEGVVSQLYGTAGLSYPVPDQLTGVFDVGFMMLPIYRVWIVIISFVVCTVTWAIIEFTQLGSYLRAATENASITEALGINVPRMIAITYGIGVGLAGLAGVLAAPVYQVSPLMGTEIITLVFAVVVIGGMGSLGGAVVSGFGMGILEGLTKYFYPQASSTIIFVVMGLILLFRHRGLFGRASVQSAPPTLAHASSLHTPRLDWWFAVAFAAFAFIGPLFFYPLFLAKMLCMALFASAFVLLVGQLRLLSFGHAAFFGTGAYTAAYLLSTYKLSPTIGLLCAVLASGTLGVVFGWLSIRRQGIYFAMITLALAQLVYFFAVQAPFTRGDDGIQGVVRGTFLGLDLNNPLNMYYFTLACFMLGIFLIFRIIRSPFGLVLRSVAQNEPRAVSLGYNTNLYKLLCFVLSAALSGLAGALKAIVLQFASLTDVYFTTSGDALFMTVIGGVGSLAGAVLGALTLGTLEYVVSGAGSWVPIIKGVIFITCVLAFRQGLYGALQWIVVRAAGYLRIAGR